MPSLESTNIRATPKPADSLEPRRLRSHSSAFEAIARWLRRACAHSARGWALAAGVPPDLTSEWLAVLIDGRASTEDQ